MTDRVEGRGTYNLLPKIVHKKTLFLREKTKLQSCTSPSSTPKFTYLIKFNRNGTMRRTTLSEQLFYKSSTTFYIHFSLSL